MDCFLDCAQSTLIGNGNCNNEANTAECNFDGGDCCSLCETIIFSWGKDESRNGQKFSWAFSISKTETSKNESNVIQYPESVMAL